MNLGFNFFYFFIVLNIFSFWSHSGFAADALQPNLRLINYRSPPPIRPSSTPIRPSSASLPNKLGRIVVNGINIGNHPTIINSYGPNDELTMGDLHGNTLKLIYFLIREGIMRFEDQPNPLRTKEQIYSELVQIYFRWQTLPQEPNYSQAQQEDILRFKEILNHALFLKQSPKLRFLGDELADRGVNDHFTLLVFEKLHQNGIPFEILLSNHGMEFLSFYEKHILKQEHHQPHIISTSLLPLKQFVGEDHKVLNPEAIGQVKHFVEDIYLKHLKILSYSKDYAENQPANSSVNNITLYSHAPIGIEAISQIVYRLSNSLSISRRRCKLDALQLNLKTLMDCIDIANEKFEQLKNPLKIGKRKEQEGVVANGGSDPHPLQAINYIIWNRNYSKLFRPWCLGDFNHINFVHGHDSNDPLDPFDELEQVPAFLPWGRMPHITNLNNALGKSNPKDRRNPMDVNKGQYILYHTIRVP